MAEKHVCQYWGVDGDGNPSEPVQCSHWDDASQLCTYVPGVNNIKASYFPNCNGIGTAADCNRYDGDGFEARCILPDPRRHVCNRETGEKWLREDITKYNDGGCDGNGTEAKCSGYAPYHMGFGPLKPSSDESLDSGEQDARFSKIEEFEYRLPHNFEVFNLRAKLSRCYWWNANSADFSINAETGEINLTTFRCVNPDEATNEFNDFKWEDDVGMDRAPCNGCKPECPGYTGVCWQHCIDEKMGQGDKVLAEQLLELRYYMRRTAWTEDLWKQSFIEPIIQAWTGNIYTQFDEDGIAVNYMMDAALTSVPDFETFSIEYKNTALTAGTPANDFKGGYPSLVRELKEPVLAPIILNKFDQVNSENIFEVTKLLHKYILIVGHVFYYNSKVYGINLSDSDLAYLPDKLRKYNSMSDIEITYDKDPEGYEKFYEELDCILEWLIQYQPEKIGSSEASAGEDSFWMNMPTFFGENEIAVFDKGSGTWEYSKIKVKKLLCNGVIGQTGFSVEGSGGTISYLPNYENDFAGYVNKNALITFQFFPFLSAEGGAEAAYIYNDSVRKHLPYNPALPPLGDAYEIGYELFKVKAVAPLGIGPEDFRIFGNACNILVTIPDDKALTNVLKPWELEEGTKIILSTDDGDVEMEIVDREENIDKLEINQLILRPKSIISVKQACNAELTMGPFYTYEKRSFGDEPDAVWGYEKVREQFLADEDRPIYDVVTMKLNQKENIYELTDFGYVPLIISAVFEGITGRIRGQTKTKMITWVRQPYCRDVEIKYTWTREYTHCELFPKLDCYGAPRMKCEAESRRKGSYPPCGDHDLSITHGKGPMWYPYEACDDHVRYNITGNLTEWDTLIMEPFSELNDGGELAHGSWDMRMFGPVDQDGRTCDTHAQLWDCTCDWSFCNTYEIGAPMFSGWGRYRGGVTGNEAFQCIANDGSLPKFGNVYRDFLRSYRSIDNIDYYYFNGRQFVRRRKWVPVSEFYGVADITADTSEFPFKVYTSSDYYNDVGSFLHPFGLMTVHSDIEKVMINENIDGGSKEPNRYRFEEVFNTHYSLANLQYPFPKHQYFKLVGSTLTPIISWYTYKDYPGEGGGAGTSIQWAWQELWKELERHTFNKNDMGCNIAETTLSNCMEIGPYVSVGDTAIGQECLTSDFEGRHVFLDVQHPDYLYDFMIGEHRTVCDEGEHIITFTPPSFEEAEDGTVDEFFWIKLDGGIPRAFDIDGNWDPIGAEKIVPETVIYKTCTVFPWTTKVTLFAEGYDDSSTAAAEADGRALVLYDGIGEEFKMYYQRGLDVEVLPAMFDQMPGLEVCAGPANELWNVILYNEPDCGDEGSNNFWDNIDIGDQYAADFCLNISYCSVGMDGDDFIELEYESIGETGGWPSRVKCQFLFGAEELEGEEQIPLPENVWFGKLYHIPAVEVFTSSDGESWSKAYESDEMELATKDDLTESKIQDYSWNVAIADRIHQGSKYVKLRFRITPNSEEVEGESGLSGYYSFCASMIKIECVYIYLAGVDEAEETIQTYERRYNISYGQHGDFPPHGYDSSGSCLYPTSKDGSTIYQYDSLGGTVGIGYPGDSKSMNKCRGRIMKACHEDKDPINVTTLLDLEAEQKKIHDEIAVSAGKTSFRMNSIIPPGLEEQLNKAGVIFPRWNCYFVNSLPLPLSPVIPQEIYAAPGHYFDWDFSEMERKVCGRLFARHYQDVFKYVYKKASTGTIMWDSMDAIEAYYRGAANLLISPSNYVAADAARAEQLQQTIRALSTQKALFEAQETGSYPAADSVN